VICSYEIHTYAHSDTIVGVLPIGHLPTCTLHRALAHRLRVLQWQTRSVKACVPRFWRRDDLICRCSFRRCAGAVQHNFRTATSIPACCRTRFGTGTSTRKEGAGAYSSTCSPAIGTGAPAGRLTRSAERSAIAAGDSRYTSVRFRWRWCRHQCNGKGERAAKARAPRGEGEAS
jgi:hypothetical protein